MGETGYRNGGERGAEGNSGVDGPRATPVFSQNRVFVFGGRFDLYALESATGRVIWKRDLIKEFAGKEITWSNAASPLVIGDRVLVAGGGSEQAFLAFRADNGEVLWEKSGFGTGQVIMAGDRLVATTDYGQVVLIEPTPSAYRELARAKVIEGKVWASPALSDGQVLLRSTSQGVCVQL